MNRPHEILLIDDEPVVRQSVERVCSGEAIGVDTASSGRIGLERLGQHHYSLILCDVVMEDLDGFQFLAEVARRGIRTPVVITTGCSTRENALRALQSGAIDFLPKPFTSDELMSVIRRALSSGAAEAEPDGRAPPAGPLPDPNPFHPARGTP